MSKKINIYLTKYKIFDSGLLCSVYSLTVNSKSCASYSSFAMSSGVNSGDGAVDWLGILIEYW